MSKIAVYPGSFDPITVGHIDIIQRISKIFDHVVILVAESVDKSYLFSKEERIAFIKEALKDLKNTEVDSFQGLTTDYMKKKQAHVIVRGLRAVADFEYEGALASMNRRLAADIETFMIFSRPEYYFISSRGVKEIAKNHGPLAGLVPESVITHLNKKFHTTKKE